MTNVRHERAMMWVDELQNYIESLDSMPRILQKNLVTELDLIVVSLETPINITSWYINRTIKWF